MTLARPKRMPRRKPMRRRKRRMLGLASGVESLAVTEQSRLHPHPSHQEERELLRRGRGVHGCAHRLLPGVLHLHRRLRRAVATSALGEAARLADDATRWRDSNSPLGLTSSSEKGYEGARRRRDSTKRT